MPRILLLLLLFVGLSTSHAQIIVNTVEVTTPTSLAGEYLTGAASFGPALIETGPISEALVLIDDGTGASATDGCEPLTAASAASVSGRVALIDRGTCRFVQKVKHAQDAGAIAVLIANNVDGTAVFTMIGDGVLDPLLTIPSVMITQNAGILFKNKLPGIEVTLRGEDLVPAGPTKCDGGQAGNLPCDGVDFEANLGLTVFASPGSPAPGAANDIWGWTDPDTGREYALVGLTNGTAFVDVTTPAAPIYLGKLPTTTTEVSWRDIKTYADHAFIVSEAQNHGMQVFDLTRLRTASGPPVTFDADALYTGITSAHNIVINEGSGFAYAVGARNSGGLPATCDVRGLHAIDISTPTSPTFASCFSDVENETGPRSPGYTHDAQCVMYDGPDTDHSGKEICFASNEDVVTIFDVSDKANVALLSQTAYPNATYTHQGWLTDDHRYFIVNDEIDEINFGGLTRTLVFDAFDLDSPDFSFTHEGTTEASDHNLYVHNGKIFQSNYRAGLRILDASGIVGGSLTEIASFDTWPESDAVGTSGQWSNYPYFPSGTVVVNDTRGGLFVLSLIAPTADAGPNQTAIAGQAVTLDGSGSSDPDGNPLTFAWTLNGATLNGADTASPTFCAAEDVIYTAELVVSNGIAESTPDEVTITVTALSVSDALDTLIDDVGALLTNETLNKGQVNALTRKLTQAQRKLDRGQDPAGQLGAFRSQVLSLEAEGVLSAGQATVLVASLDTIAGAIASPCPDVSAVDDPFASATLQAEAEFGLSAPYPNPTDGRSTIAFSVEDATEVRLSVYDALGREVAVLMEGSVPSGRHELAFDGQTLETGTYLVRLTTADGLVATHRLTLLR